MERRHRERPDAHDRQVVVIETAKKIRRETRGCATDPWMAERDQKADPVALEAPSSETEQSQGRGIEPLGIVDGDEHRRIASERSDEGQDAGRQNATVDRHSGRLVARIGRSSAQKRNVNRVPLQLRQDGERASRQVTEQVRQPTELGRRVRFALPDHERQVPVAFALAQTVTPESGLADPRLTVENHRGEPDGNSGEEPVDLAYLGCPTDRIGRGNLAGRGRGHESHLPGLWRPTLPYRSVITIRPRP